MRGLNNLRAFCLLNLSLAPLVAMAAASGTVRVSEFGHDPEDSTPFIQKALDSGARRVVLDRIGSPWHSLKLEVRSNTELVFEPGVELVARRGEFLDKNSPFICLKSVTNVTIRGGAGSAIRMWKRDYQKPPYAHSEWRHAIMVEEAVNFRLEGLRIADSGGDGLALYGREEHWTCKAPSRDVVIRNCVFDGNHRQGISVFSVENLLIENTVLSNTSGTAPEAGIDFEPNLPTERLVNCVMRNCLSLNNSGRGYDFYFPGLTSNTAPVFIRLENCRSVGNAGSLRLATGNRGVRGSFDVVGCSFQSPKAEALLLTGLYEGGVGVAFSDCTISNAQKDVILENLYELGGPGKLRFDNMKVFAPVIRPWLDYAARGKGPLPSGVGGKVIVCARDGSYARETLDEDWKKRHMPAINDGKPLPPQRELPLAAEVVAVDACPGELVALSDVALPWNSRYVFFVDKPCRVRFVGRQSRWSKERKISNEPVVITEVASSGSWKLDRPQDVSSEFGFDAPRRGFYRMFLPNRHSGPRFHLEKASVPVAVDFDHVCQTVLSARRQSVALWLDVQRGAGIALAMAGGSWHGAETRLFAPDGRMVSSGETAGGAIFVHDVRRAETGLWRLEMGPTKKPQDVMAMLDLFGCRPYAFLSSDKLWKCR